MAKNLKIIINDSRFIISAIDAPMQNTEAEAEDATTDRSIDLQGASNSRTVVNSVETVQSNPKAAETP